MLQRRFSLSAVTMVLHCYYKCAKYMPADSALVSAYELKNSEADTTPALESKIDGGKWEAIVLEAVWFCCKTRGGV